MFELDFDQSQPPIMPPRDVWIAKYKEILANEQDQTALETDNTGAAVPSGWPGRFAGGAVLIESVDYEEIING